MKLSMWTIADKLIELAPIVRIVSGEMKISSVRTMRPNGEPREDILYVYLAEADGSFGDADYVCCVNGPDWMKLKTADVQAVTNVLLDIFESFQSWNTALDDAVAQGKNIQDMLELSRYALPFPIIISDTFGNVVAYSKTFDEYADRDAYWNSVVMHQRLNDMVFSEAVYTEHQSLVRDWDTVPRIYQTTQSRIIGMHLTNKDEIVGSVTIVELGGRLTNGVCQLAGVFREVLSKALAVQGSEAELRTAMALAEEYLDGKETDANRLWDIVTMFTGREDEELELILMNYLLRADFTYKNNLAYRLTSPENGCFALVYHDYVAAVIRCSREKAFFQSLWKLLQQEEYLCGVSLPFSDVSGLQKSGNQAALALLAGGHEPGKVSHCVDHAYTYFLNKVTEDKSFVTELLHPGLAKLKKYDEKHSTNFYESLYQYLIHERNVVATAKSLFIHRNSMIYRLQRIEQLLEVDLDDPNVRLYLMLSYQIEMVMNDKSLTELLSAVKTPSASIAKAPTEENRHRID